MTAGTDLPGRIYKILFYLLAAFPLIPVKIMPFVIGAWCVVSVYYFSASPLRDKKKRIYLLLFTLLYFFYLASLLYDPDKAETSYLLERKMSLLFVPICFFFSSSRHPEENTTAFMNIFILSAFAEALWVNAAIIFSKGSFDFISYSDSGYAYRDAFEKLSHIHPTYMALMFFFAALLNVHLFFSGANIPFRKRSWRLVVTGLLLLSGIMLGSRTPLFAFAVSLFLYLAFRLRSAKKVMAVISVFIIAGAAIIFFTPVFKSRLAEFENFKLRPAVGYEQNSANIRIGIYHCSLALLKMNWVKGYGAGGLQHSLNACYELYPAYIYKEKKFNTHNEFLNVWLSLGLAGFIIFLSSLIIPFIYSLREKHIIYGCFIVFFSICCLTENLLSRQVGIVFFAVFNSLFAFRFLSRPSHPFPGNS